MKWEELVNAESKSGEWDLFFRKDEVELSRFDVDDEHAGSFIMTKESFLDLVELIRRIT